MSLHKDIIEFATKRVEDIVKRPEMWASTQEALELQVLQLMEIMMLVKNPEKLKSNPRIVLDMHVNYIAKTFRLSYAKPMFAMNMQWSEIAAHLSALWQTILDVQ